MADFKIPVMRPLLPRVADVEPLLEKMDTSRRYSNWGPLVQKLENEYATFFNIDASRVVALSNATQAIIGCIQSLDETDIWVIPEFTFSATGLGVRQAGKQIISVDVDPSSFIMDTECFDMVTRENFGLLYVLPFGRGIDIAMFNTLDYVIIDAAASIGAPITNLTSLKNHQYVVFSLHATKVLGSGEGSIVICGSSKSAQSLRRWANFGFDESRISQVMGTNAKMSEIAAAYALAAYAQKDIEFSDWKRVLNYIDKETSEYCWRSEVTSYQGVRPYWIAQFQSMKERNLVQKVLSQQSIETRNWWPSLMSESPGVSAKLNGKNFGSKKAVETTLGLPLWRDIPLEYISLIAKIIQNAIR